MVILLFALLVSIICKPVVESEYMSSMIGKYGYIAYSVLWASVYLFPSFIFAYISYKMLNSGKNGVTMLIAILSLCMVISALLSLVMISRESYYALLDLKSYWGDLYSAIEILIAFIVGGNGLNYLANCNDSKRSVSIFDSDYHWTGKFK